MTRNQSVCAVCGVKYKSKSALLLHTLRVHSSDLTQDIVERDGVQCNDDVDETRCNSKNEKTAVKSVELKECRSSCSNDDEMVEYANRQLAVQEKNRELRILKENPTAEMRNAEVCHLIATANNMVSITVPGDGSCQYHAVLEGLKAINYGESLTVEALRKRVYWEIMANLSKYEEFLTETEGSIATYAQGVLKNQWGDEITLRIIGSLLNIRVQVLQFTCLSQCIYTFGNPDSEHCIYLTQDSRIEGCAHYGTLVPCNQYSAVQPCSDILSESLFQSKSAGLFRCDLCRRTLKSLQAFIAHAKAKHSGVDSLHLTSQSSIFSEICSAVPCSESLSETLSVMSDMSVSARSDESAASFESCVSYGSRKSARLNKHLHSTGCKGSVFKVPDNPTVGEQQCPNCGKFFRNLKRHKKCMDSELNRREKRGDSDNTSLALEVTPQNGTGELKCSDDHACQSSQTRTEGDTGGNQPRRNSRENARTARVGSSCHNDSEKNHSNDAIKKYFSDDGSKRVHNMQLGSRKRLQTLKRENRPWTKNEIESVDPNYKILKQYHDNLAGSIDNFATEKITTEVVEVIDVDILKERVQTADDKCHVYTWTVQAEEELNRLSSMAKTLKPPNWPWSAPDDSSQGRYNHSRMKSLVTSELTYKILHSCPQCGVTALLVGDQMKSPICIDCVEMNRKKAETKKKYEAAWTKVRPTDELPKTVRRSNNSDVVENLPNLNAAEQSVIALVQPIVTVQRNFLANKKYRQECINLMHNAQKTWCKILPRKNLQDRFVVIERRFKNSTTKYMLANPEKVRVWLSHLFKNHSVYMRKMANKELELSEEALAELERQSELASVDYDTITPDIENKIDTVERPPPSCELDAGLSKTELFGFDQSDHLYLKKQNALKVTDSGKVEIIKDDDSSRQALYDPHISANIAFPHLYPNGETAPVDCGEHTLARHLLKKQTQFAQKTVDGKLQWSHGEHGVHMMHQYARLVEMNVRALVGWYINQKPERANVPLESVLNAFRESINNDQSAVDSQMPELQGIMTRIRNSREKWFAERQGIETVSRDMGDANVFMTLNCDPRAWPDVRQLVYELKEGIGKVMPPDYFEINTEEFTRLLDMYASQIAVYLNHKVKMFLKAFLCDICRITEHEKTSDSTHPVDRSEHGWFWSRVEYTQTRGVQHWHILCKLPGVLDTSLLGRMVQNMRVVREELKYGNIKNYEKAWEIISCGLLASRYLVLFANSVSTCSFFSGNVDNDQYDNTKVIDLDAIRNEYVQNYVNKNINKKTHPIMRQFNDDECDKNENVEMAKVAAVSCMHHCIQNVCGGDENSGKGCRFSFPKKNVKYTVPVIMEVNENQMEVQMLMRRTNGRIPNLQKYFLMYYRANHDVSVLIDSAHKMRYASKYVSKSGNISVLLNEIIEYIEQKSTSSVVPPTIKQTLTQLLLADCSHRTYMSKQELAYKVMDLPQIRRSFDMVRTVAHYPRAVVIEDSPDSENGVVELSDRTEYSAYSERCWACTECKGNLKKEEMSNMNLREFSETINFKWLMNKKGKNSQEDESNGNGDAECDDMPTADDLNNDAREKNCRVKWRCRDRKSGHWLMWRGAKPRHIKSSTVLYTDLARNYTPVDGVKRFFDLPVDKRNQLKRACQEMIIYLPWQDDPDRTFLADEVVKELEDGFSDPDCGSRYSLKRLEEYFKVYMRKWNEGLIAQPGTQWHRDNQYSYTMHLATHHNRVIHEDRVENDGMLMARMESTDDVEGSAVEIQPKIITDGDDDNYPSARNFLTSDVYEQIEQQEPMTMTNLNVAYPDNDVWKELKERVTLKSENLFMANPPKPEIELNQLTEMQRHAYNLVVDGVEKVIYIYGKAGCGKTAIALHLCHEFSGRVQAAAATGKAAANFNGPTIHGAFMWGAQGLSFARSMSVEKKQRLQNFYKNTELFIFDEINACSADLLSQIDETMKELFCAVNTSTGKRIEKPFGGKSVVFLGDSMQLRPIKAAAIYDASVNSKVLRYKSSGAKAYFKNAQKGQEIYRQYLVPKCVWLQRGQRNSGLLQQIMDNMREGKQADIDLDKLLYHRQKYPDFITQRGIHYSNESATLFNCRQLLDDCKALNRHVYVCRAVYSIDKDNEPAVRALSAIPASDFGYAQDVLCLAEGCEVRLITNLNTSAGLVTNSTGRVVQVIYDNADAEAVVNGEYPPAYCVIVHFPSFQGFISKSSANERYFPFSNHQLVPVFRQKFTLDKVPRNIRTLQARKLCYREQFPLDLSTNLTAHRGQGQTWRNCTLSVNLGFESPQNKLPSDAASIAYVACTRVTKLKDLFVSPIFPTVWLEMGKSERDVSRRNHEDVLRKAAKEFASVTGKYSECIEEMEFCHDFSKVDEEWNELVNSSETLHSLSTLMNDDELNELKESLSREREPVSVKPATRQRFIGIDQGIRTFSMVAIDKSSSSLPKVVGAYQVDLKKAGIYEGKERFNETDVLLKLEDQSPLFDWIRGSSFYDDHKQLEVAERVVVALEQISIKNAYSKQLGKNLATALQRQFDVNRCVVKMSQPHVHRENGPMFKLGDDIVEACQLQPPSYERLQTRIERKRHMPVRVGRQKVAKSRKVRSDHYDDVEPSDSSSSTEIEVEPLINDATTFKSLRRKVQEDEYRKKKTMSSAIFKYVINATQAEQVAMQMEVDTDLQTHWRSQEDKIKLDDMGDAFLHAVDAALCNRSKYRQLVPCSPTLQKNRTVVIAVLPTMSYWITMNCVVNKFVVEDIGRFSANFENRTFGNEATVDAICNSLHPRLYKAVTTFDTSLDYLSQTGFIKIVVKQLKSYNRTGVSPRAAGALTNSTVKALTNTCDNVFGDSTLSVWHNKKTGWRYGRTCKKTGRKVEVSRSTGKHLNAILSCLQWMKSNVPDFVRDRPLRLNSEGKLKFFEALVEAARTTDDGNANVESVHLSTNVVKKLKTVYCSSSKAAQQTMADLILIALDSNQQYVSAISTNFRRSSQTQIKKQASKTKSKSDRKRSRSEKRPRSESTQFVGDVCMCLSDIQCKARKHARINIEKKAV